MTCSGEEDLVRLLGLLEAADTWRLENGRLAIALEDGRSLLFKVANSSRSEPLHRRDAEPSAGRHKRAALRQRSCLCLVGV